MSDLQALIIIDLIRLILNKSNKDSIVNRIENIELVFYLEDCLKEK